MRNFSVGPVVSIGHFQKVQCEMMYFTYEVRKMETRHKLCKNYAIHGKNCRISVRIVSEHP